MNCKPLLTAGLLLMAAGGLSAGNFTPYVNPLIGTGAIAGGLSGNNYPGATRPFGMVQLSPDTHPEPDWYNASGYQYGDTLIYGFSHTHLSGTGVSDLCDITLIPTSEGKRVHSFSHADEKAGPGYYSVGFSNEAITAELSATPRVGIHRYSYAPGSRRGIILDLDHSMRKGSWDCKIINAQIKQVAPNALAGYRVITGWAKLRRVYFYAEFSEPIATLTLSDNGVVRCGAGLINGCKLFADMAFAAGDAPIVAKVALSNVSVAGAEANLRAEAPGWNFDHYVAEADRDWDAHLGKIEVEASAEQMTTFYTALYHALLQPNRYSDVTGEYTAADYSTRSTGSRRDQYTMFSLWDTYRAAHPLYTLIEPQVNADCVNSMLDWQEDYGYLPIWQLWGNDNYCMIGNHAIPVVVDAVMKGAHTVDPERAYQAVRASSLTDHLNSPFTLLDRYGYMPEDMQTQSVSLTLEVCFDDWCVAQLAKHLGHMEDYAYFSRRAEGYANIFDTQTGFFRGRNSDGTWVEPFDALLHGANGGSPYTEGNAWQYYWYVPHAVDSLVALTGGRKAFEQKLDEFFSLDASSGEHNLNVSGMIGQYAHGNEPSHHVAYLYNHTDSPWKGQRLIRQILDTLYDNTSAGYAGNDDCGEMSAWYVLSALGFYPVNPCSGEYYLGTPLFDRAVIHLEGGDFTITATRRRPADYRVKTVRLDGQPLDALRLRHSSIVGGSTLHFILR